MGIVHILEEQFGVSYGLFAENTWRVQFFSIQYNYDAEVAGLCAVQLVQLGKYIGKTTSQRGSKQCRTLRICAIK